jgi:hypothetical protein
MSQKRPEIVGLLNDLKKPDQPKRPKVVPAVTRWHSQNCPAQERPTVDA